MDKVSWLGDDGSVQAPREYDVVGGYMSAVDGGYIAVVTVLRREGDSVVAAELSEEFAAKLTRRFNNTTDAMQHAIALVMSAREDPKAILRR